MPIHLSKIILIYSVKLKTVVFFENYEFFDGKQINKIVMISQVLRVH